MKTWRFIFLGFAFARRLAGAENTQEPSTRASDAWPTPLIPASEPLVEVDPDNEL